VVIVMAEETVIAMRRQCRRCIKSRGKRNNSRVSTKKRLDSSRPLLRLGRLRE